MHGQDSFMNEVFRRLADTGEANLKLQKDKDALERERDELRKQLDELLRQAPHLDAPHSDNDDEPTRTVDVNKLKELEEGIKTAQESYQKIEAKLKANNAQIAELARVNEALRKERIVLEARCQSLNNALKRAEDELKIALAQIDSLREQLEYKLATPPGVAKDESDKDALQQFLASDYRPQIATLESEVQRLTRENRELKEEKERYQHNLEVTSQKLKKIKTSDHSLRESLAKIPQMARQMGGHSRSSSITSGSHVSASNEGISISAGSVTNVPSISVHRHGSPSNPTQQPNASISLQRASRSTMRGIHIEIPRAERDVEDEAPTPRPAFTFPSALGALPLTRRSELAHLPVITPDIDVLETENLFSRELMARTLGGSHQPLIVRVSKQNVLSKGRDVHSYLCPGLDHNPWCPSVPGHHGYIFVGLGREKNTFADFEMHHVFVGIKRGKDTRRFKYVGKYRAVRVTALTVAEWQTLDLKTRTTYAKTTKEKNKDPRSIEDIMKAYDTGDLMVPCVRLQCIGFDATLYQVLLAEAAKPPKPKTTSSSSSSNKRALGEYEADAEVSSAKRRSNRHLTRAS